MPRFQDTLEKISDGGGEIDEFINETVSNRFGNMIATGRIPTDFGYINIVAKQNPEAEYSPPYIENDEKQQDTVYLSKNHLFSQLHDLGCNQYSAFSRYLGYSLSPGSFEGVDCQYATSPDGDYINNLLGYIHTYRVTTPQLVFINENLNSGEIAATTPEQIVDNLLDNLVVMPSFNVSRLGQPFYTRISLGFARLDENLVDILQTEADIANAQTSIVSSPVAAGEQSFKVDNSSRALFGHRVIRLINDLSKYNTLSAQTSRRFQRNSYQAQIKRVLYDLYLNPENRKIHKQITNRSFEALMSHQLELEEISSRILNEQVNWINLS